MVSSLLVIVSNHNQDRQQFCEQMIYSAGCLCYSYFMADVLLIDDDPLLRSTLLETLQHENISVEDASDGLEGLEKARNNPPKVIILDEMMPRMSGQQFIESLRMEEWGKKIEVVVLTAIVDTDMVNKKLEAGVFQYIDKTHFSTDMMVALIKKLLGIQS